MTKKEITLYIAADGLTFATEEECLWHEAEVASNSAVYRYRNLPRTNIALPFTEDNDFEYEAVYCACQDDLSALKEAKYDSDCVARSFGLDMTDGAVFPVWLLCAYSEDGFGEIYGTIEDVREKVVECFRCIEMEIDKAKEKYKIGG